VVTDEGGVGALLLQEVTHQLVQQAACGLWGRAVHAVLLHQLLQALAALVSLQRLRQLLTQAGLQVRQHADAAPEQEAWGGGTRAIEWQSRARSAGQGRVHVCVCSTAAPIDPSKGGMPRGVVCCIAGIARERTAGSVLLQESARAMCSAQW